jgi:MoxR-like ATPase
MEDYLLFRKRSPLEEEGLGFLLGCEEHTCTARRNRTGRASSSATFLRALLSCLEGKVLEAWTGSVSGKVQLDARVQSSSIPGGISACSVCDGFSYFIPHGSSNQITYHLGILAMLQACVTPESAQDLIRSYHDLMMNFRKLGKTPEIKPYLLQTADELYYWFRYRAAEPIPENDRLAEIQVADSSDHPLASEKEILNITALTDPTVMEALITHPHTKSSGKGKRDKPRRTKISPGGFVGEQLADLKFALNYGENVLLAGYTGTGKTMCVQQAALARGANLVVVEGKEGMIDLDFLGSYLPQLDGTRRWQDGPVLRAIRLAETEPVILFLDELNRFPRMQVNILIGLMNRVTGKICHQMGMEVEEAGEFYVIEIPITAEVVSCPTAHLRFIAAGNFGRSFAVYDLDPALRRRFSTVIDFDFLSPKMETALLKREHPRLSNRVIDALVQVAVETRRMLGNGELPGCVDTASLLNWADKCERETAISIQAIMDCARRAWADQVCGRNHVGLINQGSFNALQDYLQSLGVLNIPTREDINPQMLFEEYMNGGS